jgi:hypothetical protein
VLWLLPLVARSVAQAALIPLAVPMMALSFIFLLRRAMSQTGAQPLWHFAPRHLR